MFNLFNTFIYQPIFSALVFIYQHLAFQDFGLAVVLLTVFVRIVLLPVLYRSTRDQMLLQRLQPEIQHIQKEHRNNKEEQTKALLALYQKHRLNPFSGFFLLLLQLPILIALYQVFTKGLSNAAFDNFIFLGLINLKEKNLIFSATAAFLQYFQGKLTIPKNASLNTSKRGELAKTMLIAGPVVTLLVLSQLPAALGLYWIVSTLFGVVQQIIINKTLPS